ncbi:hypothetical protein [Kitasatospora sp. NPDC057015]|uniref:hypothetical protein n=1 Tax=Kitasatospora sp. NPDC057015 TaxID=3346001 RepID=UPI003645D983
MSRGWIVAVIVVAVAGIASTPVFWLMDGPDTGQLVGASVQGAVGVAAFVWAVLQHRATASGPGPLYSATDTGAAAATGGGVARTGVRHPGSSGGGGARAERTGNATADGQGSTASTGVDHS